jgi:Arc/MetJ family transcription regulator
MMWVMRTTVDLPDDLHQQAMSIARDTSRSFSETVADLMRRGLGEGRSVSGITRSDRTGLPVIHLGTVVTTEDVRALEDD